MTDNPASGSRDLNGRVVEEGRWARLRARLAAGTGVAPLSLEDPGLLVVAGSDDDSVASSTALESSSWRAAEEVVLRHVLALPEVSVATAEALAAQDGYRAVAPEAWPGVDVDVQDRLVLLVLARVQLLDAMHLSQERSRMASLGSRHGGTALCWHVLQRPGGAQR